MAKIWQVTFTLPYTYSDEYKEKNQPKIDTLYEHIMELTGRNIREENRHVSPTCYADKDQLLAIYLTYGNNSSGDEVRIQDVEMVLETPAIEGPLEQLRPIMERLELAAARVDSMATSNIDPQERYGWPEAHGWNGHTNGPIPGPQLLQINRLKLLQDCCTDHLQEQLADGWRIIAACPQEARRPDYVLGKCDLTFTGTSADR